MPERSRSSATASRAAFVDERLITALLRAFGEHAGDKGLIDAADLKRALGLRSEYLASRLLARFDRDGDGFVRRDDFLDGVQRLVLGSDHDKLRFAFKLHDHDDDGAIDQVELDRMIALSLGESGLTIRTDELGSKQLAARLMGEADTNGDGQISFAEFEAVVQRHPRILERMTRSEALWIVPSEDLLARLEPKAPGPTPAAQTARWLSNHWRAVVVVSLWALANIAVLASTLRDLGTLDPRVAIGAATGRALSMNAALILLPVLRRLTSRLRASWFGRVLPIDEAIDFHRLVGHAIAALSVVHVGALTYVYALGHPDGSLVQLLTGTRRGMTGALLAVALCIMWVFALEKLRRSRQFEVFFYTHLLYVAWLVLAIVHEPRFLLWTGVPILLLLLEHVARRRRRAYATVAYAARALRSGVTELEVEKPAGFEFRAGDYAYLRLPTLSRHEWHPFTISSAPETNTLTFHIRSLGNWSRSLRELVEAREREGTPTPMVVYIDGPYGSPTAHLIASKHAVLIGAGIGVTPFASVLSSMVRRVGTEREPVLEKGHFFWLNRDQYSFEWFANQLGEVELLDKAGLFDLHLHMTGGRSGATSAALEAAREVTHAQGHPDLVTGLQAYTHLGRPDWKNELRTIRDEHAPERVDVFFCGPPGLGAIIRKVCRELKMPYYEERF